MMDASAIGGMIGPMIGGAAGSMFQPGSKAKDEATGVLMERLAGWDQYLASVQSRTAALHAMQRQAYLQPDVVSGISSGLAQQF